MRKIISLYLTTMTGTLHEDRYIFLIMSRSFLPRMRNVSENVVEKIKTHILCSVTFFEYRVIYEIMWKNIVEPDSSRMTIWRMHISRRIPRATNTQSQHVIHIAFPLQHWLHERYMYIA